jgi:hypothetical protein
MSTPPIVTEYAGPTPYKLTNVNTNINVFNSNTPFYPNQISDLAIWLDGKDILNNGSNNPNFGDSIGNWANKAPNNITVTQNNPLFQPVCADNNNGVLFSNANEIAGVINGFNTTYGGAYLNETIFILLNNDNSDIGGINYNLLFPSLEGARQLFLFSNLPTQTTLTTARLEQGNLLQAGYVTQGDFTLVSSKIINNSEIEHYINGSEPFFNEIEPLTTGGNTVIGTDNYGNNGFNGTISEVIIYSNAISDSDRQKVESYLRWKWNSFTLDPLNPYATQAYSNIVPSYPNINSNIIPPVPRNLFSGLPGLDSNSYPLIKNFIQLPNRLRNVMF